MGLALSGLSGLSGVYTAASVSSLLTGLAAYWPLQELSGNSRIDSVGGLAAVETGGAIGNGAGPGVPLTSAAQFVTSRTLNVADNAAIQVGVGSWTICTWIYHVSGINGPFGKESADGNHAEYALRGVAGDLYFYVNATAAIFSGAAISAWHFLRCGYNAGTGKSFITVDEGTPVTATVTPYSATGQALLLGFFRGGANWFNTGRLAAWGLWKRLLTAPEIALLAAGGSAGVYPFDSVISATPDITMPVSYQVAQTSGLTGTIPISGNVKFASSDVYATFNGGTEVKIATGVLGAFSANLTGQANGQGTLAIRANGNTASKTLIGLGDIFIVAGQSNASGRGTNNQAYSHASLKATMFGNDYVWKELIDPIDSSVGQIDAVSSDAAAAGSIWPLVATSYLAARSTACAFVPCAFGGSSITAWQPGANHQDRTTLYGSMVYRALQTGAKAILWWQGETDAVAGMATATYQSNMDTIVTALAVDLPNVTFMPVKLHLGNTYSDANAAKIQTAISNIWSHGYSNVAACADLSDLRSDAADHFTTNASLGVVAGRVWTSVKTALGW